MYIYKKNVIDWLGEGWANKINICAQKGIGVARAV